MASPSYGLLMRLLVCITASTLCSVLMWMPSADAGKKKEAHELAIQQQLIASGYTVVDNPKGGVDFYPPRGAGYLCGGTAHFARDWVNDPDGLKAEKKKSAWRRLLQRKAKEKTDQKAPRDYY